MSFNFIEVCAGAGGLSCGLIESGFKPVLLNDNNKDCCNTLKMNHNDKECEIICDSMENIDFSKYKNIDLLCGGIPCQSFSQSGKRLGMDDPRGKLIFTFIKILNMVKPKMFLIENVKGLLTHNSGQTIKDFIELLNENNLYNIKYKLLNSFDYNVPQKRERVFIVGLLKEYENISFNFPEKKDDKILLKDILHDVPESECAKYTQKKIELFKHIPQGGCWTSLPLELQKEYLGKSFESGGGKRGILHRLSMDKPCLTLLCSPQQKQTERCHPIEDRPLSVREYARIQTFKDSYEFFGSMSSKYKQIGNAVPVNLAKFIGNEIFKCLKQIKN